MDGTERVVRHAKKESHLIGEWPDIQRQSAYDWLTCSSGDIERSHLLLVYVPSIESCYGHVVFAKQYYNCFLAVSRLLCLI